MKIKFAKGYDMSSLPTGCVVRYEGHNNKNIGASKGREYVCFPAYAHGHNTYMLRALNHKGECDCGVLGFYASRSEFTLMYEDDREYPWTFGVY
jgi:hypothetical protein